MRNQLAREKAKECLFEDPASEGKQDKVDANFFEVRDLRQQVALQSKTKRKKVQCKQVDSRVRECKTLFDFEKRYKFSETYGSARIGHVLPGDALGQPPVRVGHVGNRVVEKGSHC